MKKYLTIALYLTTANLFSNNFNLVTQNTTITTNITTDGAGASTQHTTAFMWDSLNIALSASVQTAIRNALNLSDLPATVLSAGEQLLNLPTTAKQFCITTANSGSYILTASKIINNDTVNNYANIISGGNPVLTVDGNNNKRYLGLNSGPTVAVTNYVSNGTITDVSASTGNIVNTVDGNLKVQNKGYAIFFNSSNGNVINTVNGNVTVETTGAVISRAHFANLGAGKTINTIAGNLNISGSWFC